MKYCRKCKMLYKDDNKLCPNCKKGLTDNIDDYDEVFLIKANGFELERIKASLKDENIAFTERLDKKEQSAQALTGASNAITNIYVSFQSIDNAKDILYSIGALNDNMEIDNKALDEFDNMSPGKRTFVRIISMVMFIIIVLAVVSGVDFIAAIIKNMF